jgi:hypothetical protein
VCSRRDCWREQFTIEDRSIDGDAGVTREKLVIKEFRLAVPEPMNAAAHSEFLHHVTIDQAMAAQKLHGRRREHFHGFPARRRTAIYEQHRPTGAAQECSARAARGTGADDDDVSRPASIGNHGG